MSQPSRDRNDSIDAFPENELPKWLIRQAYVQAGRVWSALRKPLYLPLARFAGDLAICVDSSADLVRGLEICLKPLRKTKIGDRLSDAVDRVRGGSSLAAALGPADDLFPPFYLPVIVAGEQSGQLGEAFRFLERHCKLLAGPAMALRNLWFIPVVIMLAGEAIRFLMMLMMGELGAAMTFVFQELFSWAQLAVIVAVAVLTPVRYFIDQARLSLPLVGPLEREISLHRFFRVLALLYTVGGHRVESMIETAAQTVSNNAARLELRKAAKAIKENATVSEAFQAVGILSDDERSTIEMGEMSGTLEQSFARISDDTGESMIAKLKIVEPFLVRFVMFVVTMSVIGTMVQLILQWMI